MCVEVDGETIHTETPEEAHTRLKMLMDEGVKLERIKASTCATLPLAQETAKRLLALMEKHHKSR